MSKLPHFEIVRASRRSVSIQISKTRGLIVRAPFSVPEDIIHAFVERKSDWIRKHLARHTERKEQKSDTLYYLGQAYPFEYNLLQRESVVCSEGMFTFSGKTKDSEMEQMILMKWYRKQAREYISGRVAHFS